MERTVFDVIPDGNSWIINRDGRTVGGFNNKDEAVAFASQEAQANEPSQVRVRRQDGTFQEERTFPRSSDPSESPG